MKSKNVLLGAVAGALFITASVTLLQAATVAPKGYVIAEITVTDPDAYKQYAAAAGPVVSKFGGKFLVRGGQTVGVEGDPPAARVVIIEFASLAAARSFEDSQDYQAIAPLRHKAARSRVFLAEGTGP
jgi:uncharacterized protein (DUF1330 family)